MEQIQAELDEKDFEIVGHVEEHGMENIDELAQRLGLSKSTIYYRIDSMKERGIIHGVTADVDPLSFGLHNLIITNVFVSHDPGYAEDVGTKLSRIKGVRQVYYTMGDVDFMVVSRTQNREQMNELIDEIVRIEEVTKTSSTFVMDEIKTDGNVTSAMSDEMIVNVTDRAR